MLPACGTWRPPSTFTTRSCCARRSKAWSTSRNGTTIRCTTRSRPITTTVCLRSSANTGWASTARRATRCRRRSRRVSTRRASSMPAWASATRSCATPSSRRSWRSTASRSRSCSCSTRWPPRRDVRWRSPCASIPTSIPRPTTASIRVRPTASSASPTKRFWTTPSGSVR